MYADETVILTCGYCPKPITNTLQKYFENLNKYFERLKIKIIHIKTKAIIFINGR